jgi:hypothetical protein
MNVQWEMPDEPKTGLYPYIQISGRIPSISLLQVLQRLNGGLDSLQTPIKGTAVNPTWFRLKLQTADMGTEFVRLADSRQS